ncbi:MAG: hypothetical protein Tsb002_08560 [Wenzhouxiangellaceae bacterium]
MNLKVLPKDNLSPDTDWLIKSVYRILRPIVRLLINRIACDALLDVVRRIYIDECTRLLEGDSDKSGKVTMSALALRTGMDSRMINKLMSSCPTYPPEEISREAAVLARWASDPMYLDPDTGQPKDLLIYGHGPTFQGLVTRAAGRNVTVNTVLDRLVESGNVETLDEFHVRLIDRLFSLGSTAERPLYEVGSASINGFISTIEYNILHASSPDDKWFQQRRYSHSIPRDKLPEFRQAMRETLERLACECESTVDEYDKPSAQANDDVVTAGFGAYYWEEPKAGK